MAGRSLAAELDRRRETVFFDLASDPHVRNAIGFSHLTDVAGALTTLAAVCIDLTNSRLYQHEGIPSAILLRWPHGRRRMLGLVGWHRGPAEEICGRSGLRS